MTNVGPGGSGGDWGVAGLVAGRVGAGLARRRAGRLVWTFFFLHLLDLWKAFLFFTHNIR